MVAGARPVVIDASLSRLAQFGFVRAKSPHPAVGVQIGFVFANCFSCPGLGSNVQKARIQPRRCKLASFLRIASHVRDWVRTCKQPASIRSGANWLRFCELLLMSGIGFECEKNPRLPIQPRAGHWGSLPKNSFATACLQRNNSARPSACARSSLAPLRPAPSGIGFVFALRWPDQKPGHLQSLLLSIVGSARKDQRNEISAADSGCHSVESIRVHSPRLCVRTGPPPSPHGQGSATRLCPARTCSLLLHG